jgi:hypothetical protein
MELQRKIKQKFSSCLETSRQKLGAAEKKQRKS